jgi:predicted RNA-binding Zn-ribbon protein involved in translation (DUF1610 family)
MADNFTPSRLKGPEKSSVYECPNCGSNNHNHVCPNATAKPE